LDSIEDCFLLLFGNNAPNLATTVSKNLVKIFSSDVINFFEKESVTFIKYKESVDTLDKSISKDAGKNLIAFCDFLKTLNEIQDMYWDPSQMNMAGGESPIIEHSPTIFQDILRTVPDVAIALKAFQSSLEARDELERILGIGLVQLSPYESTVVPNEFPITFGGLRKRKTKTTIKKSRLSRKKQNRSIRTRTFRHKQQGGGGITNPEFPSATYRYFASLRTIAYGFNEALRSGLSATDIKHLMENILYELIELNTTYMNEIGIPVEQLYSSIPIETIKSFEGIDKLVCAVSTVLFSLEKCPSFIGQRTILSNRFFKKADITEDLQVFLESVVSTSFGFDSVLTKATIAANQEKAFLQCIRSIQSMAERYYDTVYEAAEKEPVKEVDIDEIYREIQASQEALGDQLAPDIVMEGGKRKTRKTQKKQKKQKTQKTQKTQKLHKQKTRKHRR
jgi:hypothetical protein